MVLILCVNVVGLKDSQIATEISGVSLRVFGESVKKIKKILTNVDRHNQVCQRPNRAKIQRQGEFSLCPSDGTPTFHTL
jgi:hypothetical protein